MVGAIMSVPYGAGVELFHACDHAGILNARLNEIVILTPPKPALGDALRWLAGRTG